MQRPLPMHTSRSTRIFTSVRLGAEGDRAAVVWCGVARDGNRSVFALPVARAARELQVALEHLGHAVHASVPDRAAAGDDGDRAGAVAVDAAVVDEAVGLADRAEAERFEPEVDEGREAVVRLRDVDLGRPEAGAVVEPACDLGA